MFAIVEAVDILFFPKIKDVGLQKIDSQAL
jgi:hypothetical protein